MTTKYAIFDPANGEYVYVNSEADIEAKIVELSRSAYFQLNAQPVSVVTTETVDGQEQETWTAYASSN